MPANQAGSDQDEGAMEAWRIPFPSPMPDLEKKSSEIPGSMHFFRTGATVYDNRPW